MRLTLCCTLTLAVTLPLSLSHVIGQEDQVEAALRMIGNADTATKIAGLESLAKVKSHSVDFIPTLIALVDHEDIYVRRWAIYALGTRGPEAIDASSVLVEKLNDSDFATRTYAATSLQQITLGQTPGAVDVLCEALWSANPETQVRAAELIGELGVRGTKAIPYLVAVLQFNALDGPRSWARPSVSLIPARSRHDESLPISYSPPCIEVKTTNNAIVRHWDFLGTSTSAQAPRKAALLALGKMGTAAGAALPFVEAAVFDSEPEIRRTAVSVKQLIAQ